MHFQTETLLYSLGALKRLTRRTDEPRASSLEPVEHERMRDASKRKADKCSGSRTECARVCESDSRKVGMKANPASSRLMLWKCSKVKILMVYQYARSESASVHIESKNTFGSDMAIKA